MLPPLDRTLLTLLAAVPGAVGERDGLRRELQEGELLGGGGLAQPLLQRQPAHPLANGR